MASSVLVSRVGSHVAKLTLNVPDKLNALSISVGERFIEAVDSLRNDSSLRAVVLTGAGRAFSAGGDLAFLEARKHCSPAENVPEMIRYYARFLHLRRNISVPIVAAINGHAVGAGACLALTCDLRIASVDAKIGFNFSTLGIHPGLGATHFLPRIIGPGEANRMLMTASLISGTEAQKIGLVQEVLPTDKVVERAVAIAEEIAKNSPLAVQLLTRTLRQAQDEGLEKALEREAASQAVCYAHSSFAEGLSSVIEKRTPKY